MVTVVEMQDILNKIKQDRYMLADAIKSTSTNSSKIDDLSTQLNYEKSNQDKQIQLILTRLDDVDVRLKKLEEVVFKKRGDISGF